MKRIARNIVILTTLFLSASLSAQHIGKNLILYGDSAISLGMGGTGVSSFGTDFFYLNPASLAGAERWGLSLNYGNLAGQYYNPDVSFALPTSYGTFGTSFRMVMIDDTEDITTAYMLSVGGGKELSSKVMFGMSINMLYGDANGTILYPGVTIGSIYKFNGTKKKSGFGFFNPNMGFSLNLGIPIGDMDIANLNTLTLGYNFVFYKHKNVTFGFHNDFSVINFYKGFPVKIGFESVIYNNYVVRAGGVVPNYYDYGNFSAGLGYKFKSKNFDGSVDYSINYYRNDQFVHNIGVKFNYGKLDRESPVTTIKPDQKYISPNHDGKKDYAVFELDVKDKSRVKGWTLQILDPDKKTVREFKMSRRDIIDSLTVKSFFKRIFSKKESLVVPDKIMWDGTGDKGEKLPDNKYTYSFYAWDERGNIAKKKTGTIILDATSPEVTLASKENLFSPNNDKKKDIFVINQKITSAPEDMWEAGFKNSKGKIVKSFKWDGDKIPNKIVWDGKDSKGKDVPEGLYYYYIKTEDKAGNVAESKIKEISLTRKYETADVTIAKDYFSFLKDKELHIFPRLSKTEGLESWKITIADDDKDVVKEITGKGKLDNFVKWNCKDKDNKSLPDGIYTLKLSTDFASGNHPSSFEKKLIIDSTPPVVEIDAVPEIFSPDGDGNNDVLTIKSFAKEEFGIKKWKISVYDSRGAVFKSFTGKNNVPEEIKWDGLSDEKEIVESAADYYVQLEAVDYAGNSSLSEKIKIETDILVMVTSRGLKMRISNIEFKTDSSRIKKKGKKILLRVRDILERYESYDIVVEGHTDSEGSEQYNLKLSEKRARSVKRYLTKNGIKKKRLSIVGMGETTPLKPNKSKEQKRRNRRVEFLLIKKVISD